MEKQKLPNAIVVLVLGILSIPSCCFYGVGIIFSIIALVLAKKDMDLYKQDPALYDGYSNINTGRILAIIGIVLNVIALIASIYVLIVGEDALREWAEQMKAQQN